MTELLEKAFEVASRLAPKAQDALGTRILEVAEIMEDEARWDVAFSRAQDQLDRWADEALAEIEAGTTTPLDFARLEK